MSSCKINQSQGLRHIGYIVSNNGDRWLPDSLDGYHVKYINSESVCSISETNIILSIS